MRYPNNNIHHHLYRNYRIRHGITIMIGALHGSTVPGRERLGLWHKIDFEFLGERNA